MKVFTAQQSGNAGEIDPTLDGRTDIPRFAKAWRLARNMLPTVQGPMARRPGTLDAGAARDQTADPQFIEFDFGLDQQFMLEVDGAKVRFWTPDGSLVSVPATTAALANGALYGSTTGWTHHVAGTGAVTTSGGAQLAAGDGSAAIEQRIVGTPNTIHVARFRLTTGEAQAWVGSAAGQSDLARSVRQPGWHTIAWTMPASGECFLRFGNANASTIARVLDVEILSDTPLELPSPWPTEALDGVQYQQMFDTEFVCGGGKPLTEIARYGNRSWSVHPSSLIDGPYLPVNDDPNNKVEIVDHTDWDGAGTLTVGATTGLRWTKDALTEDSVGRWVRIGHLEKWGAAVVESVLDPKRAIVVVRKKFFAATATDVWRLGAFTPTSQPAAVAAHDQRLYLAGCEGRPSMFFGSRTQRPRDHSPTVRPSDDDAADVIVDSSAVAFNIAADRAQRIRWMKSARALAVGTSGSLWTYHGGKVGAQIAPAAINGDEQYARAVAAVAPARTGSGLLFAAGAGRQVHHLLFRAEYEGFLSDDLSVLAPSLVTEPIRSLAWVSEPHPILWIADYAGRLSSLTYSARHEVYGYASHRLGGGARVSRLAAMRRSDGDWLWLATQRPDVGRRIERMPPAWNHDGYKPWHYLDGGALADRWNRDVEKPVIVEQDGANWRVRALAAGHAPFVGGDTHVGLRVVVREDRRGGGRRFFRTFMLPAAVNEAGTIATLASEPPAAVPRNTPHEHWCRPYVEIGGLDRFAERTVDAVLDGAVRTSLAVSATGVLPLPLPAGCVSLGAHEPAELAPLTPAPNARDGASDGRERRGAELTIRRLASAGGRVLWKPDGGREIGESIDKPPAVVGEAWPLLDGPRTVPIPGDSDPEMPLLLRQDAPLPFTVLSLAYGQDVMERPQ